MFHKMAALKIFCKITQKSFFNGQYSWRRRIISGNWNPLKNHEKYFLFHLNKLIILLANQILHILWFFIKPNVWYSWSLKVLAIKRWFLFNFSKTLQGRHFVVGGTKNFKLLADTSFESSPQNTVLPSLLLFLCACYYFDLDVIQWNEVVLRWLVVSTIVDPLYLIFLNIINLRPNIWFIKKTNTQIFHICKRLLFRNGQPNWYECWRALRDLCGLSKKCGFATFPEI